MWMFEDTLLSSLAVTFRDNIIPSVCYFSLGRIKGGAILEEGNSWLSFLYCGSVFKVPTRFLSGIGGQDGNSFIAI